MELTVHMCGVIGHYVFDLLIPMVCMAFIFAGATTILDFAVEHL